MTCVQLVFVSPYKVALGRKEEKNHELKTSEMSRDLTLEFRNAPDFLLCLACSRYIYLSKENVHQCIITKKDPKSYE